MREGCGSPKKSDRVMALVLVFEGELVRLICAYGPQGGRALVEKDQFYDERWSAKSNDELVLGLETCWKRNRGV